MNCDEIAKYYSIWANSLDSDHETPSKAAFKAMIFHPLNMLGIRAKIYAWQ